MAVRTVKSELQVTKEFREIVDFLGAVLKDVKEGKKAVKIAADQFPALFKAVDGFDQLSEEVHSVYLADNAAYLVKTVMNQLRKTKPNETKENPAKVTKKVTKATKKTAKKATKKVARKSVKTRRR